MEKHLNSKDQSTEGKNLRYQPNVKLKRERELRGWSQTWVAENIGAQPRLVTRWEMGYAFPSPYYRQKLCQLFDKNAEELGLIKNDSTSTTGDSVSSTTEDAISSPQILQEETAVPVVDSAAQVPAQDSRQRRFFSRRTAIAGMLGGAIAGTIGSFWWMVGPSRRSGPSSPPSVPKITTLYVFPRYPAYYINDVAWSPHGDFIVCASGDHTIQIVKATTGDVSVVYRGHTNNTDCADWSHDASRVASTSADMTVQVWDPTNGNRLFTYTGHTATVYYLAWSHNSTLIASTGKDSTVQVWDASTGAHISTYLGHQRKVWSVRWSPDDRSIVSGGEDGSVHVWDPISARPSPAFNYQGPQMSNINEVDWSPDGRQIASAHADGNVYLWDALGGALMLTYKGHKAGVRTARWSPNGQWMASGSSDYTIHIWNPLTGKRLLTYNKHTDEICELSWAPDGKRIASGSLDHTMHVCQVQF